MAVLLSEDGGSWRWPHGRDRPRVWVERSWLLVPRGSHKPLRAWRRGATAKQAAAATNLRFLSDYPARPPDLNSIENLFGIVNGALDKAHEATGPCQNLTELRTRFKTAVEDAEEAASVFKMVDNYPRRLAAVIKAEGGPAKY